MNDLIDQTLEMMRLLDSTEEYADCILWTGATTKQGYPIYKQYGRGCTLVRRKVFELTGGVLVPRQPVETMCGERLCINPAHLNATTVSGIAKRAAARGAWSGKARASKIAASKRGKGKLTMDDARVIRLSDESGPVLAARYGVNRSLVNGIKRGKSWKDYSNPVAGLMA